MTHRNQTRTRLAHISKLIDQATDKRAKAQLNRTYQILIKQLTKYPKPKKLCKMKNSETKKFETKVASILSEQKNRINNEVAKHLEVFGTIELIKFNNETPYNGEVKNKIFLTHSDHYRANLGAWMSVGYLNHPHTNMDDRGYIKGVATDLDGYLKLRSAKMLNHNFDCVAPIYFPKFRKSKNREQYIATCNAIVKAGMAELNEFILEQQKVLNQKLNEMTGCSLLHYLRDI